MNQPKITSMKSDEIRTARRDFMGQALKAAGFAVSGSLFPVSAFAQGPTPKRGGLLKLGLQGGSASDSLDPRLINDSIMMVAAYALMNGLVQIGPGGKAEGELLESWESDDTAKKWTFNVRKGIKFTSGKLLDADDVIYSINLHRGKTVSPDRGILKPIQSMTKVGSHQIQIELDAGNVDFPYVLSDYHLLVVPNGFTNWAKPDGTGAFELESFTPGVRINLKGKGDGYWKANCGNFDAVQILYINDTGTRTAALRSGEIDGANRLDPRTVDFLIRDPQLTVVRTRGTGSRFCFEMDTSSGPFKDPNLRLAMKYGINREQIIKTVFNGYATLGNDDILDPQMPFYDHALPQRHYDPEKAKFYFAKAGAAGRNIELVTSTGAYTQAVDCAELFQQSLASAGIKLNIKRVAGDGYWSTVWMKVPFCASYWGRRPTADIALTTALQSDSNYNDTHWKNPKFDRLLAQARVERDEAKRAQLYDECQKMVYDDGGILCFAIGDYLDGYSKRVRGNAPTARYDMSDDRICETGWFA
jgi:peptide/nickel transport system substrate-binding protein